jgi:hypothetical protein
MEEEEIPRRMQDPFTVKAKPEKSGSLESPGLAA